MVVLVAAAEVLVDTAVVEVEPPVEPAVAPVVEPVAPESLLQPARPAATSPAVPPRN